MPLNRDAVFVIELLPRIAPHLEETLYDAHK